jgi:thiol-disulfide isomerase/thioredoxin
MKLLLFGSLACVALFPHSSAAAVPLPAEVAVAAEADAVLKKVAEFYLARQSASTEITLEAQQAFPGEAKRDEKMTATLTVARPNLLAFRLHPKSDDGAVTMISDGKTLWSHIPATKQFTVNDVPAKLDDLLRDAPEIGMFMGQLGLLTELFRDHPRDLIANGLSVLRLVGTESVDGIECTRIHGEQEEMDWDAWFQTGEQPALRKFAYSPLKGMLATAPEEVKEKLKAARIDVTVSYAPWKFDAALPEKTFAFEPPKNAKKVAEFGPPEEESAPTANAAAAEPETLKGKPAADFALDLLGGGKMQLAQHKGKEIVVLDFWATWCGPCVRALPALGEVALAYKDKGVVVYAVNQQEQADVVKKFLETKKLALTVAMDAKGDAAKLYQVRGIPQTVIIDKEGNIAALHVGYSPTLKDTLTKEIEALLAK